MGFSASIAGLPRLLATAFVLACMLALFSRDVDALGLTDTITWGGDNSRTGYQSNHNMDPSIVGSPQFGQLFKTTLPGRYNNVPEQIFSQPLVYTTPSDGVQYLYVATAQNNVYKMNAKTGEIILKRNLHIPFLAADLDGCVDIQPHIGITATGVIDPDTNTLYLTAKTYVNQNGGNGAQGKPDGRYYVHAISVDDLSERPNFPVDLEGTVARNSPTRNFNGGIHHQRPALLHTGQYIYAGFASHCVQYNFTGWIMGWDKTTGATVERWSTEGEGVPNTTPGGGIWMSGGGIASDDAGSIFFGTGNGYASQLSTIPVNGRNPPTAIEQAAVHMTINDDGSLTLVDFFMPWEKQQLDGADKDLGTTPLEILPSEFSCGDVKRIGVITGKSGKTYWLNLDDLGGYKIGPDKLDNVIQVYQNENSVYAGAGVYPLEGGYIYINGTPPFPLSHFILLGVTMLTLKYLVIQFPTHVFKFACNAGIPSFTKVADSPSKNAYVLGVGHGTVTSLNGQIGTGLVWTSDVQGFNLQIYKAVPENGLLTQINQFNIPGTTKFTRPVFGDGRAYVGTTLGFIYGFGSPVNLPLNCSSPYDFGIANLNNATIAKKITCTALSQVTISNATLTGDANFVISNMPSIPATIETGGTFSFDAVFNPKAVGPLSSDVILSTTNNVAGFSTSTPVSFRGTGQSVNALLQVSPLTLAFQAVIAGNQVGGVNQSVLFNNLGNSPLSIPEIKYSIKSEDGPFIPANGTAAEPEAGSFKFMGLPSTIPGNSGVTVQVNFDTSVTGNFAAYLNVVSNGGTKIFDVLGTAGSAPVALVEFQTPDGNDWVKYEKGSNFTFGNVTENTTRQLKLRVTNNATTDGASLSITVSKPPFGIPGIIGANNQIDLAEGTILKPGENATATLYCSVPKSQWNMDPYVGDAHWTMNVNDLEFSKQDIPFTCGAVSEQAAPLQSNGLGYYRYTGCFKEDNPGRQLKSQLYSNVNNTQAMCIAACAAAGQTFCGTQYNRECWTGPTIPNLKVEDGNCNFPCAGDVNQICGGDGLDGTGSYISLFADMRSFDGNTTIPIPTPTTSSSPAPTATGGPQIRQIVGNYVFQGCYNELTVGGRALSKSTYTNDSMTLELCSSFCSEAAYFGVEYGRECYCGNTIATGSTKVANQADCDFLCPGDKTTYCGASSRLQLYALNVTGISSTVTSSTLATSSTSLSATSTFSTSVSVSASSSSSTVAISTSLTSSSSTPPLTGPTSTTIPISTSSSSSANQTPGSSTSVPTSPITTTSTSLSSSRFSTTSSAAPTGPTIIPSAGLYNYIGCYTEGTHVRALGGASFPNDTQTVPGCAASCSKFKYFGMEYSRECWCGNSFGLGALLVKDSECSMTCAGDKSSHCGASNRLNVYFKNDTASSASSVTSLTSSSSASSTLFTSTSLTSTSVTSSASTSPSTISSSSTSTKVPSSTSALPSAPKPTGPLVSLGNSNFTYYSCVSEPSSGRLLQSQVLNNRTAMTIPLCLSVCSNYKYAGVEYGRECWCANKLNLVGNTGATPAKNVTDDQCNFACPGNATEACGASSRMSLFWFDELKAKGNGNSAPVGLVDE
ncbi:hypothetical protein HYALB_00010672 [Hymenoscyphus albidus]|uniref:WSC domain-containing protein n=1 Tax=Hymenoscyphus albidus TaxID=595503 RepID=A0A9N9LDA0_9HELO|nr:hypothetical protein HYALB_00010672 [Hymenoscyphus albidus]